MTRRRLGPHREQRLGNCAVILRSEILLYGSHSRSDLRAFCCDAPVAHGDGSDTALKYSDQKRKRRSSMRRVAPGVRSYPSRLCRAGSGFRFSIWNSLVLDPVIIGRLQLGAARCCAYRGHRPVAGRRTEFRRSTAASRWRHLGGGRLGIDCRGQRVGCRPGLKVDCSSSRRSK